MCCLVTNISYTHLIFNFLQLVFWCCKNSTQGPLYPDAVIVCILPYLLYRAVTCMHMRFSLDMRKTDFYTIWYCLASLVFTPPQKYYAENKSAPTLLCQRIVFCKYGGKSRQLILTFVGRTFCQCVGRGWTQCLNDPLKCSRVWKRGICPWPQNPSTG